MKVTIIGAGNMGRAIGTRMVAGGHELQLVDRKPGDAGELASELGGGATAAAPGDELTGEVVVLALYYPGVKDAVAEYGERLAGRVVVDISNPIDFETLELATTTSGAEEIAALVPAGTPVVKAFNTAFASTVAAGEVAGQKIDVFVAGDDEDAKRKIVSLVEGGGLRAIDAGPLVRARLLEQAGRFHIALQEPLGTGFGSALKLYP
ncbi:MAG: NADPH-dependent F420 reductase [Gaiellaceae bacterium]